MKLVMTAFVCMLTLLSIGCSINIDSLKLSTTDDNNCCNVTFIGTKFEIVSGFNKFVEGPNRIVPFTVDALIENIDDLDKDFRVNQNDAKKALKTSSQLMSIISGVSDVGSSTIIKINDIKLRE